MFSTHGQDLTSFFSSTVAVEKLLQCMTFRSTSAKITQMTGLRADSHVHGRVTLHAPSLIQALRFYWRLRFYFSKDAALCASIGGCCTSLLAVESARRTLRGSHVVRARCDSCVVRACASRHARLYIVGCCCFLSLSSESLVW